MHTHTWLLIVLAAALPLSSARTQDAVYKWVDEQGRTHYSDQQPDAVENPETIEVFDAPEDASSQSATHEEELKRLRELSEALEAAREDRERERLEKRLAALERAYYQQRLKEDEQRKQARENVILYPGFFHRLHPHFAHPPNKKFPRRPKIHGHRPPGQRDFVTRPDPKKPDITDSFEHRHAPTRQVQPPRNAQVDPPRIRSMGIQQ